MLGWRVLVVWECELATEDDLTPVAEWVRNSL